MPLLGGGMARKARRWQPQNRPSPAFIRTTSGSGLSCSPAPDVTQFPRSTRNQKVQMNLRTHIQDILLLHETELSSTYYCKHR